MTTACGHTVALFMHLDAPPHVRLSHEFGRDSREEAEFMLAEVTHNATSPAEVYALRKRAQQKV